MFYGKHIAVVIPAYNEQNYIGSTLRGVPDYVDTVIVVDDASTDSTAGEVQALSRVAERFVLLRHKKNSGVGAALVTGYTEARKRGADVIAVMAGDGQMDPADLAQVLEPVVSGCAEYVKGNRLIHLGVRQMPLARRLGTAFFGKLTAFAIGVNPLGDSQCGFTAIAGSLLDAIPMRRLYPRYGYPNDLLSWVVCVGGRVAEVPVRPVYGTERSGLRPWHAFIVLALITRAYGRRRWGVSC